MHTMVQHINSSAEVALDGIPSVLWWISSHFLEHTGAVHKIQLCAYIDFFFRYRNLETKSKTAFT